jgi:hypothetical protein
MKKTPITKRDSYTKRQAVLLRAAYDLLTKADREHFVEQATYIVVRYDEANCDGGCLREDIAHELEIDPNTDPIPLEPE